ncbi:MAG: DUF3667 domain-containing protein [Winogradskyella sp.]|uniref:DUF3667 domain-containing protein n=1 Tax=Winogradskyella sp. TaxID=1883156 RepID=UPI00385CAF66
MDCKNCHKTLRDTQKFCDDCGAKVIRNRLTPKVLLTQVNEQFLSLDNTFLRTFIDLFKKPDIVIDGYINGTRKKYIDVITFYAVSLTILGFQMFLLQKLFPEFLESSNNAFTDNFKVSSDGNDMASANFSNVMNNYQGVVFSIFMPLMAIGTWVVFMGKQKHNYTEHVVINLYIAAQTIFFSAIIFIFLAVINVLDFLTATFIVSIPTILYGAYVFKKIYQSSYINALLRYLAAYIIYMIVFTVIIVLIVIIALIYALLTGKINL